MVEEDNSYQLFSGNRLMDEFITKLSKINDVEDKFSVIACSNLPGVRVFVIDNELTQLTLEYLKHHALVKNLNHQHMYCSSYII